MNLIYYLIQLLKDIKIEKNNFYIRYLYMMDFIETLNIQINKDHNVVNKLNKFSKYLIYLTEKNIILIAEIDNIALHGVDFKIIGKYIDNQFVFYKENEIVYIGYNFYFHYDEINYFKWNNYEKCNIYLLNTKDTIMLQIYNNTYKNTNYESYTCSICLSNYDNNNKLLLRCNHYFCKQCINNLVDNYLEKKQDIICPMCRDKFNNSITN